MFQRQVLNAFILIATVLTSCAPTKVSVPSVPVPEASVSDSASAHLSVGVGTQSLAQKGLPTPDFSVVMNDGSVVTPGVLRGQVAVIAFFSTACYDCRRELPILNRLYSQYPDVKFVCISRAETDTTIRKFWVERGLSLPYSAQVDNRVFKLFAPRTIPRIYVLNRRGVVTAMFVEKASERALRKAISKNLTKDM